MQCASVPFSEAQQAHSSDGNKPAAATKGSSNGSDKGRAQVSAGKGEGTVRIQDTGLEFSRFEHLGIRGQFCSERDVSRAKALIDATKVGPGAIHVIPLRCYRGLGVSRRRGGPIWVTKEEHDEASDQWDGESVLYEIDTQWGMLPMGGAYKDSLHYSEDGRGGYLGEGFGY